MESYKEEKLERMEIRKRSKGERRGQGRIKSQGMRGGQEAD